MAKKRRTRSRSPWPLVLMLLVIALVASAVIWLASLNQSTQVAAGPTDPAEQIIPFPNIERVSLQDAYQAYQDGSAVFVDVRGDPFYFQAHIPGALNIPLNDLPDRIQELDPSAWIITYCT